MGRHCVRSGVLALACLSLGTGHAMTILVNYESSVPAAAQGAFNQIVAAYDQMFINAVTVTIDVAFANLGTNGLGQSQTQAGVTPYATWDAVMQADAAATPWNTDLAKAVASLPSTDPLKADNGSGNVTLTFANALALGYSVPAVQYDSTLTFTNNSNVTFEYNGVAASGKFDFIDVAEHELDEALGIGSALTGLANCPTGATSCLPATTTSYYSEDYFRYSAPGVRAITTSSSASVYFSYNGGNTMVAQFNQNNSFGDRNDWIYGDSGCPAASPGPYIQDADTCPNNAVKLTANSPEVAVLGSLGWTPVPEPGVAWLIAAGLTLIVVKRRLA